MSAGAGAAGVGAPGAAWNERLVGRALGLAGLGLALAGWRWTETLGGGLAWAGAVLIACAGYGGALELALCGRAAKGRGLAASAAGHDASAVAAAPLPLTMAGGLAAVMLLGALLGHLGLFAAPAQRAVVGLGLLLCLAVPPRVGRPQMPLALAGALTVGLVLACLRLAGEGRVVSDDDLNHLMALARLWQTGAFPEMQQQLGGQLVGEALISLSTGAWAPFFFDGVCGLLVIWLLTSLALRREHGFALPVVAMLAFWMLLMEQSSVAIICRWPSALFFVVMFAWLRERDLARAIAPGRGAGWIAVIAAALCTLRFELVPVALVLLGAAAAREALPTWSRPQMLRAAGLGVAALTAIGLLGGAGPLVVIKAAACLVVLPAARLLMLFIGTFPWWSAPNLALSAAGVGLVAAALSVGPPGSRSVAVALAIASHLPLLAPLILERATFGRWGTPGRGRLYPLTAAAMMAAIFFEVLSPLAYRDLERGAVTTRFVVLGNRLEQLATSGGDTAIDNRMRRLQHKVPPGARLGVWGKSAARLDYHRNPIIDVSWNAPTGRRYFLAGLSRKHLADLDYLVVEAFARTRWRDYIVEDDVIKATHSVPTIFVEERLELLHEDGRERLYRVLR